MDERQLVGARFVGGIINIAGVVLAEGEIVRVVAGAEKIERTDTGGVVAPESEVRRYLEDWPFQFEPVEVGPVKAEQEPVEVGPAKAGRTARVSARVDAEEA